jgi:tetratricopeptide (TPR) repeat protein
MELFLFCRKGTLMATRATVGKTRKKKKKYNPFKQGFWKAHWKEAVILFLVSVGLYAMTLSYEFVLDDQIVITENTFVKKGISGIAEIFGNDSFTGYFGEQKDLVAGARYRPLSIAMFALEYELAELDVRLYHGMNILLYGLLVLLVFRIVALLVHTPQKNQWILAVPFVAALLFALHPVHSEAVANIKGLDEILALTGSLLSLYAVLRYYHKGSILWLMISGVFFFIGLLAKENTITFLAVIPAALYFFTERDVKKWLIAMIPALIATAAYITLRFNVIGFLFGETTSQDLLNDPFLDMSISEKYATIMYTLGLYLKLLFFPHPLTHDYYPYHIPIMNWSKPEVIASVVVYAGMFAFAVRGLWTRSMLAFNIIFFVATISVISNVFFPVGTFMNERFIFMPSLAFCIGLAYYAELSRKSISWMKWVAPAILGLYVIGFTYKTIDRTPAWKNPMTLNTAGVAVSKNSTRANCFMGTALYQSGQEISDRQMRLDHMILAESYIDKSLSIHPRYLSANQMKSGMLAEHYRFDRDLEKLLSGFEHILDNKPNVAYIPRYCEYLNGRNVDQRMLLDFYYRVSLDIMLNKYRRNDYALKYVRYGLELNPEDARINFAAGKIYESVGDSQKAMTYLDKAYRLDPRLRGQ